MGKGKRNKQLRVEDTMGAPEKRQNKNKKQFVWPVWAKRAICIALLVAVLAGIIIAAVISSGIVMRGRIIVESKSGKFDMNQQMATFILWQAMYQQGYNEWINDYYYQQFYNSSSSSNTNSTSISKLYSSPDQYGLAAAASCTKGTLNSSLNSIKDYLIELVAGADAAIEAGMKYEAHDKEDAKSVVTWMQNIYVDLGLAAQGIPFKNFLTEYVGDGFKTSDIEDAAKVMVMYSKYSDYKSFDLQDDPTSDNLQDYILRNPAGYFETKYFTFTGADEAMIRDFFTDEFISDRFESTIAKHYANIDRLAIADLKGAELTAKLEELQLNNANEYTKTTTDGEDTYSSELPEAIGKYIFSTSNKSSTFAAISGDKCAYLIYFKETSTATKATVAYKEYSYEDAKVALEEAIAGTDYASIDAIKEFVTKSIIAGENISNYMTDNDKAEKFFEEWKKDIANFEDVEYKDVTITKGADNTDVPQSIVNAIYPKDEDATPYNGWIFVINDPNESYVVKVTDVDSENAKCVATYVTYTDDFLVKVLTTFEAEFSLYLLESKVTAPTYSDKMTFEEFKEKVINWLIDENLKELILKNEANELLDELKEAMADSGKDTLATKLNEIFGENGVKEYEDFYSTEKALDPSVYDYIFNSKNKDTASVIVGKDDRVFLVYVAPTEEGEHEGHNHAADTVVKAAIKEFEFDAENEENAALRKTISDALSAEGRKDPENFAKSADDLAKAALEGFKKTEGATPWEGFTSVSVTKKDTGKDYQAIIDKIYPNGKDATSVSLKTNEFYQVDDDGTSYVFKITEINSTTLDCKVEYVTYKDEENYSYFRAIKSKLDSSFKEDETPLEYPSSITSGSYQEWLFKNEYKAAEGDTKASLTFERKKDDLTFIATTDSKGNITSLTIYMVDTPAVQENDTTKSVYGAYQLFETKKEAQKALDKLKGKTGFELLDIFTSFKHTEKVEEYVDGGHLPGYVSTTSPTIGVDLKDSSVSDKNLKKWLFETNHDNYDVEIIEAADGKGYYLAVFASSEETWSRSARSGWVDEAFTEHMKTLVEGYEINEKVMEKIDDVVTTTAETTTPAVK